MRFETLSARIILCSVRQRIEAASAVPRVNAARFCGDDTGLSARFPSCLRKRESTFLSTFLSLTVCRLCRTDTIIVTTDCCRCEGKAREM